VFQECRELVHRSQDDKDLFQDSTMTFGEHLEELRVCLFRAIVGLAICCVIGLIVGDRVADFIQGPLRKALERYYEDQAVKKSSDETELAKLRKAGYASDEDVGRFQSIIREHNKPNAKDPLSFEVVYIDPKGPLGALTAGQAGDADLKPVVLFRPIADDPRARAKSFNSQEAFMIYLKASLFVGAVLSAPWVFYQIWTFVAAGLYRREKRYVHVFLPISIGLFLGGASLAFFFVFQPVLNFLFSFNSMLGIDPEPRINEWMGFVLLMPLGFGVSFQLPLVMLFMERIGIFTVEAYRSSWRVAVLAIFILALILTPSGDPYSMCLMALPLCVLYFGGILLCRFMPRQPGAFQDG
jgi:sec-independent protein translocase protein TatC